ncbi:hypothetical protein NMG46_07515 [Mesorhizobium sp. LMG 17147]|uniref:hypothetical protein n=1 Tax=Mesorhizobium sp. LMG 17147 TaxID=2963091 RepID=UPI0020C96D86|nr:hypothetical protein [Mesorhizobium sp. LMG 17147]MCP9230094.1 hypothetical protein [Mesorhizobium sp. LMG 17147]
MTCMLVTSDNIDFAKAQLRAFLPQVRSSHLTEALACGLGYCTNAALLASVKSNLPAWPILSQFDFGRISNRLAAFGHGDLDLSSVSTVARSPMLPDRIWIEFTSGDVAANDRWFRECNKRGIPNLWIAKRRKCVEFRWDCISIDPQNEGHVQGDRAAALVREMFKTYQTIARRIPGKSLFSGSSFVGSVDHLLPELAVEIADTFFSMLYEPMRRQTLAA